MEIRDEVRDLIINELNDNQIVNTHLVQKKLFKKYQLSGTNDVAVSSKGTAYVKSKVIMYLHQHGIPVSEENINQIADLFPIKYDEFGVPYTESEFNIIEKVSILNDMTNDEIMAYINAKTLIELNNQKKQRLYEYTVLSVRDTNSGSTDITKLENTINEYASQGWRVHHMFTNELGVNSTPIGLSASVNSTIDEVVVVFERLKI